MDPLGILQIATITRCLVNRWPGCTIGQDAVGNYKIETADGELIAIHEDFDACLRAADALENALARKGGPMDAGTRGGEG